MTIFTQRIIFSYSFRKRSNKKCREKMCHSEKKSGGCCTLYFTFLFLSKDLLAWKWRESHYVVNNQQREKNIHNKFVKLVCYLNLQIYDLALILCNRTKHIQISGLLIYNLFHNFFIIFDVLANFFSPQVKRFSIITYKHCIYKLPYELPSN